MKSNHLCICIRENGKTKVNLTFQSRCASFLTELIPPTVHQRLVERSIDIHAVMHGLVERDYAPGDVFRIDDGTRNVHVWLE